MNVAFASIAVGKKPNFNNWASCEVVTLLPLLANAQADIPLKNCPMLLLDQPHCIRRELRE